MKTQFGATYARGHCAHGRTHAGAPTVAARVQAREEELPDLTCISTSTRPQYSIHQIQDSDAPYTLAVLLRVDEVNACAVTFRPSFSCFLCARVELHLRSSDVMLRRMSHTGLFIKRALRTDISYLRRGVGIVPSNYLAKRSEVHRLASCLP